MRKWTWILAITATLGFSTVSMADLLLNEGFADPAATPCTQGIATPASDWTFVANGSFGWNRNNSLASQVEQICDAIDGTPLPDQDGIYATMENGDRQGGTVSQEATVVNGNFYRVGFKWANLWSNPFASMRFRVEAVDGTIASPGAVLAAKEEILVNDGHDFIEDSFSFQATSNTVTINWIVEPVTTAPGCCDFLLSHMDYIELTETACIDQPTLDNPPISEEFLVREATTAVTITGSNFTEGVGETISVTLFQPGTATTITADSATVDNDDQISASFTPAATDPPGKYNLVVERVGGTCDPVSATNAVDVILPALSNGSFENPDNGAVDCFPEQGVPTDWLATEDRWGFENRLGRNGVVQISEIVQTLTSRPTCPSPDGIYYGTMATGSDDSANAFAWQTLSVTNGSTYTLSGQFAHSGAGLNAVIQLIDGDSTGTVLAETLVRDFAEAGSSDWSFNFVEATATSDVMTIALKANKNEATGQKAFHADALVFGECIAPITATSISSATVPDNSGVATGLVIQGTGFAGTPTVLLSKPGTTIEATVTVDSPTQLTIDADLTGVSSGRYDVVVIQDNCVASLTGASGLLVIATDLINGSFELPDPQQTPCTGRIGGPIDGWNVTTVSGDGGLVRDSQAPSPDICPNPTDGGHYGSLVGTTTLVRAWQTVATTPGVTYRLAGEFSGGPGGVIANLNIRQGDEEAAVESTKDVFGGAGSSGVGLPWIADEITATATGDFMTVEVEMDASAAGGLNMDAMVFEPSFSCNDPRADADGDGDVDGLDFATFQLCLSLDPFNPDAVFNGASCGCQDLATNGVMDSADFNVFAGCASGPFVPALATCDD